MDIPPIPPRRELFADEGARIVWQAILSLPAESQHLVLLELQGRLAVASDPSSPHGTRIARAVAALREAASLLGGSPSINQYEGLRAANPDWAWPPAGSIRTWFGRTSWNDCLRRARLESKPDGDALVVSLGSAFTNEEVIAALKECAADLKAIPSFSSYLGWARQPEVRKRDGRRPSSQGPFTSRFGGFTPALIAAGIVKSEGGEAVVGQAGEVRMAGYFISDATIGEAIHEVKVRLGHTPRVAEYLSERLAIISESQAAGAPRTIPSYNVIQRRYVTWDDALVAHGLPALGGRATGKGRKGKSGPNNTKITKEMARKVLREAFLVLGDPFTVEAYKGWRIKQIKRDRAAGVLRRLPSHHTIWKLYGSWFEAVNDIREPDPTAPDETAPDEREGE